VARINFHDEVYKHPSYGELLLDVGDIYRTKGLLITAWELAQTYWLAHRGVPADKWPDSLLVLVKHKFAAEERRDDGVYFYVSGSEEHCAFLTRQSEAGKKGGRSKSPKKTKNLKQNRNHSEATPKPDHNLINPTEVSYSSSLSSSFSSSGSVSNLFPEGSAVASPPAKKSGPVPTAEAWKAYGEAYREKYGADPVRNATTNSQMVNFVKRIGAEEAPHVLRFYVQNRSFNYGHKMHPIGIALTEAEKLRTEWATGRTQTQAKARQEDQLTNTANLLNDIREGKA
jgi:hypothetical protein